MGGINTGRLALGALIAGVIYFICDGLIHGGILAADYEAAFAAAGKPIVQDPTAYAYFAVFDLGKGLVAMLIYVFARARLGPGVVTAVWAGAIAWLGVEALPQIAQLPFPFYPQSFYLKAMALSLPAMILGAVAGAWPYKE